MTMKTNNLSNLITFFLFLCTSSLLFGQNLYNPEERVWKPAKDDVYLQEVAMKINTENPVTDIALVNGNCFVLMQGKINKLDNDRF